MSEIIRDSGLNDLPFSGVDCDVVYLVRRFMPDKSAERTVDVVSQVGFFSVITESMF